MIEHRFLHQRFRPGQNGCVNPQPSQADLALAARIRELMERDGITGEHLAEALGVTPAAVARWRKSGKITRENIVALARHFDVSIDWLLTGELQWGETPQRRAWIEQIEALSPQQLRRLQAVSDALVVADDDGEYDTEGRCGSTGTDC